MGRTLLVSGLLDAGMRSRANAGEVLTTPHLEFGYAARDFTAVRETGASWKVVTEATPEPKGIDRPGRTLEDMWPPRGRLSASFKRSAG